MKVLKKITEEELEFMESLHTPICLIESLFSNFDNLTLFDENKFGHIRLYQHLQISDETLIDFDTTAKYYKLSEKEKFQLRKNVGDLYDLGGRSYGKTICSLIFDLFIRIVHLPGWTVAFGSANLKKIRAVLDRVKVVLETHPILKNWKKSIKASTAEYKFVNDNNSKIESVNFKIGTKQSGNSDWYGKHVPVIMLEESSLETAKVAKARRDAESELGAVYRVSGMTNFIRHSPAGQIFYDKDKKGNLLNFPQYINPTYDKKKDNDRIKEYNGKDSVEYRVFVKGEVVADAVSIFDMDRIKFDEKNEIKSFELNKDNFNRYETVVVVERPKNVENVYICSDVSDKGTTEIMIIFEINGKYYYKYNITLRSLDDEQHKQFFKWLGLEVKANCYGIDVTEALGRALARYLQKQFGKEHIIPVGFNEKIPVDYERNEDGEIIFESIKGKRVPKVKTEWVVDWSIRRLLKLLYEGIFISPIDYKLEIQLTSVQVFHSGQRVTYKCISTEDHLFQSLQVFSILQWNIEFKSLEPVEEVGGEDTGAFVKL